MEAQIEWSDELEWRKTTTTTKQRVDGSRAVEEAREQDDEIIEKQDREIEEDRKIGKEDRKKRKLPINL